MAEPEVKKTPAVESAKDEVKNIPATDSGKDVNELVMEVFREVYLQTTEDLREFVEKVRHINEQKKALRKYANSLREFKAKAISEAQMRGTNLCSSDKKDLAALAEIFAKAAHPHDVGLIEHELCIPKQVPPVELSSVAQLDAEIGRWEDKLDSVGDDAQLANIDLQNILQRQQQALQMLSNISKTQHETALEIIRNIKG